MNSGKRLSPTHRSTRLDEERSFSRDGNRKGDLARRTGRDQFGGRDQLVLKGTPPPSEDDAKSGKSRAE